MSGLSRVISKKGVCWTIVAAIVAVILSLAIAAVDKHESYADSTVVASGTYVAPAVAFQNTMLKGHETTIGLTASGVSGAYCANWEWTVSADGVLTLFPVNKEGEAENYDSTAPWVAYKDDIKKLSMRVLFPMC